MQNNLTPSRRKIGPLDAIEFEATKDAPTIVLFHGYGADGADLARLALESGLEVPARWVFPDAPMALDFGGLAWWQINVEAIERAQRMGRAVDLSRSDPDLLGPARQAASEFLEALGVPWERLILGGFSQGSMLAVDLTLRAPRQPRGLAILSGNLINEKEWRALARARAGLKFFQSHGIADPILGFQGAKRLEALLTDCGLNGKLLAFEGGHSIPPEALEHLTRYLDSVCR